MTGTPQQNAVLVYVNLRRRRLAVVYDAGIPKKVSDTFLGGVVEELRQDLRATHYESAISAAVLKIGQELARHFPAAKETAGTGRRR